MSQKKQQNLFFPVREQEAMSTVESLSASDPVTSNVLRFCLAKARMRTMRWQGLSEDEWVSKLPVGPFDMQFFVEVLRDAFSRPDIIESLLRGESLESATGWDI